MTDPTFIITGTDTNVGKTVFAAALTWALNARYWKPIQAGLDNGGDAAQVAALSGLPQAHILAEAYRLTAPCSPHQAAAIDNLVIDTARLALPRIDGPLVVEGAGGVLVPLTCTQTFADVFKQWRKPVIIVARTALGTINHSLLSIEALRARQVPIHGIAFVGDEMTETEATIVKLGQVRRLGRLPLLPRVNHMSLVAAFQQEFDMRDFSS